MSKTSHSFSVSVAQQLGISGAIILQHLIFLQGGTTDGWVKKSNRAMAETYPYLTEKQIRGVLDRLEKDGITFSRTDNTIGYDRTKSYFVTDFGRAIYGELPFDKRANGTDQKGESHTYKRANGTDQKGESINVVVDVVIEGVVDKDSAPEKIVNPELEPRGLITPLNTEKKDTPLIPAAPPANTPISAAITAADWCKENPDQLKSWIEMSRFRGSDIEPVILGFFSYYMRDAGPYHKVNTDSLSFFRNGFPGWLINQAHMKAANPTKPKQQINGGSSADKFKEKQAF